MHVSHCASSVIFASWQIKHAHVYLYLLGYGGGLLVPGPWTAGQILREQQALPQQRACCTCSGGRKEVESITAGHLGT